MEISRRTQWWQVRFAQWMMRIVFCTISELGPSRLSVRSMSVSSLLWQVVIWPSVQQHAFQGFNKHASSLREAVSDSRRVTRCTENFQKSTVAHMCRSFDSTKPHPYPVIHSHSSPLYYSPCKRVSINSVPCLTSISICGIVRVPALSSRYHLDSHRTWLTTLVKVSEIQNVKWQGILCECVSFYDLLPVSLLSRVSRINNPITQDSLCENQFGRQCTKSIHFWFSIGQGSSLLSSTFTRQEELINVTQRCKMCFSSPVGH